MQDLLASRMLLHEMRAADLRGSDELEGETAVDEALEDDGALLNAIEGKSRNVVGGEPGDSDHSEDHDELS